MQKENIIELTRIEFSDEGELIRYFLWNNKEFCSVNNQCYSDDAKVLMRVVLQQAINDFIKYTNKEPIKNDEKYDFETAKGFLFDDDYQIDFGDISLTTRDVLYYITGSDPNMDMFREGILIRLEKLSAGEVPVKEKDEDDYQEEEGSLQVN
jgi:hypothetical protein